MSEWLKHYRSNKDAVWIKCHTSDGIDRYMHKMSDWVELVKLSLKSDVFLQSLSIQYRSHEEPLDIVGCDRVYLITSVMGSMGNPSRDYLTFGKVIGDVVEKQMWLIPELIVEKTYNDTIENCFKEAIINVKKER
jgi:hypothetical protein